MHFDDVTAVVRPSKLVLDEYIKQYGQDQQTDEYVQLNGHADERAKGERESSSESLQHAEVLEGDVVVVGTAQVDET